MDSIKMSSCRPSAGTSIVKSSLPLAGTTRSRATIPDGTPALFNATSRRDVSSTLLPYSGSLPEPPSALIASSKASTSGEFGELAPANSRLARSSTVVSGWAAR